MYYLNNNFTDYICPALKVSSSSSSFYSDIMRGRQWPLISLKDLRIPFFLSQLISDKKRLRISHEIIIFTENINALYRLRKLTFDTKHRIPINLRKKIVLLQLLAVHFVS